MPILNEEEILLWKRIQDYNFDEKPGTPVTFLKKLCKEHMWSKPFGEYAISEYKHFVFLCCVQNDGASPSPIVDEVWHLHLTYTKTYWHNFCKNVLKKELHHFPSNGEKIENENLRNKYIDTLFAYKRYFDKVPPIDIWPNGQFNKELKKNLKFPIHFLIVLFIGTCSFPWLQGIAHPFNFDGEEFLAYYLLLIILTITLYVLYMIDKSALYKDLIKKHVHTLPNIYQIAFHLYDKHHAIQTALLNLMDNGLMVVTEEKKMETSSRTVSFTDQNFDVNPFKDLPKQYPPETEIQYDDVMNQWYNPSDFKSVSLNYFLEAPKRKLSLIPLLFILSIGILRTFQGIANDKPILFLVLEMALLLVAFYIMNGYFQDEKPNILEALKVEFEAVPDRSILSQDFALSGRGILAGIGSGYFIAQTFPRYNSEGKRLESGCSGGSCTSSGCSSGGGGDGGSCGGGCGGCGGGGD